MLMWLLLLLLLLLLSQLLLLLLAYAQFSKTTCMYLAYGLLLTAFSLLSSPLSLTRGNPEQSENVCVLRVCLQ